MSWRRWAWVTQQQGHSRQETSHAPTSQSCSRDEGSTQPSAGMVPCSCVLFK